MLPPRGRDGRSGDDTNSFHSQWGYEPTPVSVPLPTVGTLSVGGWSAHFTWKWLVRPSIEGRFVSEVPFHLRLNVCRLKLG